MSRFLCARVQTPHPKYGQNRDTAHNQDARVHVKVAGESYSACAWSYIQGSAQGTAVFLGPLVGVGAALGLCSLDHGSQDSISILIL